MRRVRVPGGWLYQAERHDWTEVQRAGEPASITSGWHPPVFVPEVDRGA